MRNSIYLIFKSYAPLITYVLNIEKNPKDFNNFDSVRININELLETCKKDLMQIENDSYKEYFFPLVAFIDERILLSSWEFKRQWISNILQKKYFNTLDSGKIFFDNFESFDENSIQMKLVYIYFLNLGFKGRYYNSENYKFEEFLNINKKYFKENLSPNCEEVFLGSYRQTRMENVKSSNLIFKRSFIFIVLLIVFLFGIFFLNKSLNKSLTNFQINVETQKITLNKDVKESEVKKLPLEMALAELFDKKGISYNRKLFKATILITSNSFTKKELNNKDNFFGILETFSKELLVFLSTYEKEISFINLYSYTSSEHRKYKSKSDILQANLGLSQRRANKLKDYFIKKAVLNSQKSLVENKFQAIGRGSLDLVLNKNKKENKVASRRVEIEFVLKEWNK